MQGRYESSWHGFTVKPCDTPVSLVRIWQTGLGGKDKALLGLV